MAERYTRDEWIEREVESYREYLSDLAGADLIDEYQRQGGDLNARYLPHEDVIELYDKPVDSLNKSDNQGAS